MATKTQCPLPKVDTREWKLLVEKNNGLHADAYKEWLELGGQYPNSILSKVEAAEGLEPQHESYTSDAALVQRTETLNAAKSLIRHKVSKFKHIAKDDKTLGKALEEFKTLLTQMEQLDAEASLHGFILAANRMANNATNWMEEIKTGKRDKNLKNLKQINEFIQSFSLIDEIRKDFFNKPEHIKDFKLVSDISIKRKNIQSDFLNIAKELLAREIADHFPIIESSYREKAERKFTQEEAKELRAQGVGGTDLKEAKKEYIDKFVNEHAPHIEFETLDYVNNMLKQTVDISGAVNLWVNPKDMGNDVMSIAARWLDRTDFGVQQKTIAMRDRFHKYNEEFIAEVGKRGNPKEQYSMFLDGTHIINKKSKNYPAFKAKYSKNPAIWNLYEVMVDTINEKDKIAPSWSRLGFRIPGINKTGMERAYSNGLGATLKEGFVDHFKIKAEDTEFGMVDETTGKKIKTTDENFKEVITNESGKEREVVPLFYRTEVAEADLSYDLLTSLLLDYNNTLNFQAKSETGVMLEVLKDVVSAGKIRKKAAFTGKKKVQKGTETEILVDAVDSNLVKALDGLIRHRIYGIGIEGDPQVAKVIGAIGNYTSVLGMAVNHISGVTNVLQGSVMSTIEATGNSTGLFSLKNKANAVVKYHKDDVGILGDIGERVPTSKTNMLIEKFNAFSEYNTLDKKFIDNNKLKRAADVGTLMGFQSMGEHLVQSVVMYSILDNIKALDMNGNYLNAAFEVTQDKSEAISIDEAFYKNDEGELELHPNVAKTSRTSGVTENDMFKISSLIRRSNRDFYGNYDSSNKAAVQRTVLGAQAMKMRGWMIPGIQKRWRGVGNFNTPTELLDLDRRSYNLETEQFEEGTYITAVKFFWHLKKEIATLRVHTVSENWNNLLDAEKGRIKIAITELGFALLALMTYHLLKDGEEPEDVYMTLYARRLYSELSTFANPMEGLRTLRSPAVGVSTLESSLEFLGQGLFAPTERYVSGRRKGELKIKRRLTKLVPVWKQMDRTAKESLDFLLQ